MSQHKCHIMSRSRAVCDHLGDTLPREQWCYLCLGLSSLTSHHWALVLALAAVVQKMFLGELSVVSIASCCGPTQPCASQNCSKPPSKPWISWQVTIHQESVCKSPNNSRILSLGIPNLGQLFGYFEVPSYLVLTPAWPTLDTVHVQERQYSPPHVPKTKDWFS